MAPKPEFVRCPCVTGDGPCDQFLAVDGDSVRNHHGICEYCRVMHSESHLYGWPGDPQLVPIGPEEIT